MKIEKEILEDQQVKLTVEIDNEPFERAKHIAARKIAKKIKVPGFRPGKAPYGVILRQVGEANILEDAIELLIEEEYPKILEEAEIDPYAPGTLQNVPELEPLTLEFVVPLKAEVELGDYQSLSIAYQIPEIDPEEVDSAIERVRQQNAIRESVDKPAQEGDTVFLRVSGIRTDVEAEEDGTIVEERFSSSVIQAKNESEWPFPGFSKELVGLSPNEEKTIPYVYPDDHEDESLRGAQAEFEVLVTNVQTQTLPDLDDELAKTASDFDSLDEWRADIRRTLESQASANYANEYDEKIIGQLIETSSIKFPPQMLEREKDEVRRGLEYNLSRQGLNLELYQQIRGLDEDGLDEEITSIAEKQVRQALVLMNIAEAEEFETDPEIVDQEVNRTFAAITNSMTPKEIKDLAESNYLPVLTSNIVSDLLTQKTMEFLRATAKGEPWPPEADEEVSETEARTEAEEPAIELEADAATEETPSAEADEPTPEPEADSSIGIDDPDEEAAEDQAPTPETEDDPDDEA